jgi:diaminohydroxyphosphoribosylaminopyrimidine deaminase/5-amino-6-(5-phosphoribosylamino)uracil reductase
VASLRTEAAGDRLAGALSGSPHSDGDADRDAWSLLERAMRRALDLAARPGGRTSPNPNVGAVALDERTGRILAEGHHRVPGGAHAERALLEDAARRGVELGGSTLVCNLEPCAHQGRTPPCAPAVAAAGFARVAFALRDPNPLVAGRGAAILRESGVEVVEGPGEAGARRLLEGYLRWTRWRLPFVHLKMAVLPDGTAYLGRGLPRELSGAAARRLVHGWRHLSPAVMVGAGTLRTDDPLLTARELPDEVRAEPWQPRRVVLASRFDVDAASRAFRPSAAGPPPLVIGSSEAPPGAEEALGRAAVETARVPASKGRVDLAAALGLLGARGVTSVLVEGGPALADALLAAGLVDRLSVILAGDVELPRARASEDALVWRPPGGLAATLDRLRAREEEPLGPDRLVTGLLGAEG